VADVKISALTANAAPATTDEFPTNQAGASVKTTAAQLKTLINTAPVWAAGSASASTWPKLTSGTVLTTAEAGALELDANCLYGTTDAGNRGVIPCVNFIRQHADRAAFATGTSQQAIFDSVANGTITLETGAYLFDGVIQCKGTSATSGNLKFSLKGGGGATIGVILYTIYAMDAAVDTLTAWSGVAEIVDVQVVTNMATAQTATVTTFVVRGSFECTGAGTLIPSVAQTTSVNTAVITAGSYFRLMRVGATTVTNCGQWT
jgi:hypothetical protein